MKDKFKATGMLFASVFLAGYLMNVVITIKDERHILYVLFSFRQVTLLAAIALFLLSTSHVRFRWIQPGVAFVLSPVAIIDDPSAIYGLGFFVMGVVLLERNGSFIKHRFAKVAMVLSYLFVMELTAVFISNRELKDAVAPTFFIASFGLFLWFLYKDRLVVFLKEPKPRLSLLEKGLSPAERSFVLEVLSGKQHKEIAYDFELSESTVRNTLARAYKRLGVEDKVGLALLGERFEIVE